MMFIPIVYYIVFRYIPMFGNIIAFPPLPRRQQHLRR